MKNQKAITLVALIITVIVLLILATVSINLVINGGIMGKSKSTVDKYSEDEIKEKIRLAYLELQTEKIYNTKLDEEEFLKTRLENKFGEVNIDVIKLNNRINITIDNKKYSISKDGKVEEDNSILPDEYQQVEYIESTGTQYIDTVFIPNQDTKIDLSFVMNDYNAKAIYGSRIAFNSRTFSQMIMGNNNNSSFQYNNVAHTYTIGYINGVKYNIVQDKNNVYIDGILKHSFEYSNFNCPGNLYLCAVNQNGTIPFYGKISVYYFKVYDNDSLVRNFIPCYRKTDNEIGLYDLVEGKFYTNQGTGEFIAGPEV